MDHGDASIILFIIKLYGNYVFALPSSGTGYGIMEGRIMAYSYLNPLLIYIYQCGRQNKLSLKDIYTLIPKTCDYVLLHGKKELRLLII